MQKTAYFLAFVIAEFNHLVVQFHNHFGLNEGRLAGVWDVLDDALNFVLITIGNRQNVVTIFDG